MRVNDCVQCETFPCTDVHPECYRVPDIEIDPADVSLILISEAAPDNPGDYYYAAGNPSFEQTTVLAFNDAGIKVSSIRDLLAMGVYFTNAVKCGKTGYGIKTDTVTTCSHLLEQELNLFPNVKAFLLMGDVAIKAVNAIAKRAGEGRVIPAGSTYKLRGPAYYFQGRRAFPSYLQVGPSFGIEKTKRAMIADDIAAAMQCVQTQGE
jgi:uracil-DNA glycosylase